MPGLKYDHVLAFVLDHPWALTASMRTVIADILARRVAQEDFSATEIAAAVAPTRANTAPATARADIAVIPVTGVIAPRLNLMSDISGGTTFEGLTDDLRAAVDDPTVGTILFDVNSPGGNVAGAMEFHREVMKARTKKPVIGQVQYLGASAAYWVLSACTEIVAAPSAMVGAIGVYHLYDDISKALAHRGITRNVISAGKHKDEGVDSGPLSDEARAHLQALVDGTYTRFVTDIGLGRGLAPDAVRNGYGEGRLLTADMAVAAGMVDRIATMSETLARYQVTPASRSAPALAATTQERASLAARATVQEPRDLAWQIALVHDYMSSERSLL